MADGERWLRQWRGVRLRNSTWSAREYFIPHRVFLKHGAVYAEGSNEYGKADTWHLEWDPDNFWRSEHEYGWLEYNE